MISRPKDSRLMRNIWPEYRVTTVLNEIEIYRPSENFANSGENCELSLELSFAETSPILQISIVQVLGKISRGWGTEASRHFQTQ